jgi:hypothetical protein
MRCCVACSTCASCTSASLCTNTGVRMLPAVIVVTARRLLLDTSAILTVSAWQGCQPVGDVLHSVCVADVAVFDAPGLCQGLIVQPLTSLDVCRAEGREKSQQISDGRTAGVPISQYLTATYT